MRKAKEGLMRMIDDMPLGVVLIFCLTLGLAPFTPPHLWEKLIMLVQGELVKPIDIFDLLMHGAPWVVLGIKLARWPSGGKPET